LALGCLSPPAGHVARLWVGLHDVLKAAAARSSHRPRPRLIFEVTLRQ
jgi:hypothetical protein